MSLYFVTSAISLSVLAEMVINDSKIQGKQVVDSLRNKADIGIAYFMLFYFIWNGIFLS